MEKWLIVHSLESFKQNPKMVGFSAKTKTNGQGVLNEKGNSIPAFTKISDLKAGDKIVYYCKGESVIIGIYEIIRSCYAKETRWPNSPFQFELKPILELEKPYDFKKLLPLLDLFRHLPSLEKWGMSLQGKYNSIKSLTDHDYEIIEKTITHADEENSDIILRESTETGLSALLEGKNRKSRIKIVREVLKKGVKAYLEK